MLGTDDKGEIEKHNIHTRRGLSRGPGPVPDGTWHHVGRGARRRRAFLEQVRGRRRLVDRRQVDQGVDELQGPRVVLLREVLRAHEDQRGDEINELMPARLESRRVTFPVCGNHAKNELVACKDTSNRRVWLQLI